MSEHFRPQTALVRALPNSFMECLKEHEPSTPIDLTIAREQHAAYVSTLKKLLPTVIEIAADESLPDCCFIEDTAIVIGDQAVISFMGAPARRGEETVIAQKLESLGKKLTKIQSPGTIDGGDVLFTGSQIFVGLSRRSNREGAEQLAKVFKDFPVCTVPVEGSLHLKSVMSAFDQETILFGASQAAQAIAKYMKGFYQVAKKYQCVVVPDDSAANVLSIDNTIVIQDGFPDSEAVLKDLAYSRDKKLIRLKMSEFIKADGALTCCSLLF